MFCLSRAAQRQRLRVQPISQVKMMTTIASGSESLRSSWAGYGAALWALIFAAFHLVWATGWYIGLEAEPARAAFANRWFLVYDLVVAGMCAFAVPVALALTMPWGRRLPRWLVGLFAWVGVG